MSETYRKDLGSCACGSAVYARIQSGEDGPKLAASDQTRCKCGAPVCQTCEETQRRRCEECGAHVCEVCGLFDGELWMCLSCLRQARRAEGFEALGAQELA